MKTFGERLKELRVNIGVTQATLAHYMNVDVVTVCHWEKSKQEPSIDALKKLYEFFRISSTDLLGF